MKNVLLILFASFLIASCSNGGNNASSSEDSTIVKLTDTLTDTTIVIGHKSGDTITFIPDTNTLKSDWQAFLNTIPDFETCTIATIAFYQDGSDVFLIAHGTLGTENLKTSIQLEQTGGGCLFISGSGFTTVCTTTACSDEANGCVPQFTKCTKCANNGKCTKTITSGNLIFPSIPLSNCSI